MHYYIKKTSKRPSGFQNRKFINLRAQEREKQSGRPLKFFKSSHDVSATSDLYRGVEQLDVQQNMSDHADEGISKKRRN